MSAQNQNKSFFLSTKQMKNPIINSIAIRDILATKLKTWNTKGILQLGKKTGDSRPEASYVQYMGYRKKHIHLELVTIGSG